MTIIIYRISLLMQQGNIIIYNIGRSVENLAVLGVVHTSWILRILRLRGALQINVEVCHQNGLQGKKNNHY